MKNTQEVNMETDKRYNADMLDKIKQAGLLLDNKSHPYEKEAERKQKANYYSGPLKIKKK